MKRIILHGCSGRMGMAVQTEMLLHPDMKIVAGIDKFKIECFGFPVFDSLKECGIKADVVIDFSNAEVVDELLDTCVEKRLALVLCTTGLSQEQLDHVELASKKIPILKSANMSLGINVLQRLIETATKILYSENFDIEIVEKHHRMKMDAPSGTALMLADTVNSSLENALNYRYDRSDIRAERTKNEIGISAIRGGGIVGEHEVIFAGDNEVLSIRHEAFSRDVFAKGAVSAAAYLLHCRAGLHTMQDVISSTVFLVR